MYVVFVVLCFVLSMLSITNLGKQRVSVGVTAGIGVLSLMPYANVLIALIMAADIGYTLYRNRHFN